MTGFGQAELPSALGPIRIEIKATNHKFLEVSVRLPNHLSEFEDVSRKRIGEKVRRGKLLVFVSSADPAIRTTRLKLNAPLAKEVFQKVRQAKETLGLKKVSDDAILREVLRYPDVLSKESSSPKQATLARDLLKALDGALASLDVSRGREGKALEKDFKHRLVEIKKSLGAIEKRIPVLGRAYRRSLEGKMKEFLPLTERQAGVLESDRLRQDVAQYVKNSDVSEEVTRLKSHLDGMAKALREKGELGRKIDFIGQEMTRETNTIGSKSADVEIARRVIELKSAIEKIREQSQNVE